MTPPDRLQRWSFGVGVVVVWATVLVAGRVEDVDLTVVLLGMVVEVMAIAVLSGPVLGVLTALLASVLVNWFLIPPYHTFTIANPENVTALVVFTVVAAFAALLVELGARARIRAEESRARAELIGDLVDIPAEDDDRAVLEPVRQALALDHVRLVGATGEILDQAGRPAVPGEPAVVDVALAGGYRVLGYGQPRLAADPDFLRAVGSAAVRAYESNRLAAERRRAEQLAAVDQARSALLAGVGHDLRTPLAGLRVAIDSLQQPGSGLSEADRGELLATAAASTDRLDELISNLLDLSRLEAGALITRPEPTDVGEVVARAVIGCPSPDRVLVDVSDTLPTVTVDPSLLERVLANLLSNALRHSPAAVPVTVTARAGAGSVEVLVVDRGPGIPADQRGEVFRPFHQLAGGSDGGSGLGLAIVDGFCRAMGVGVSLEDTPGGGLSARLALPEEEPT